MKKTISIIGIIVLVVIVIIGIRLFSGEDDWIKDERGVWIKHGAPAGIPENVKAQQEAIDCTFGLYNDAKINGMNFNSQCLGSCGNYVVDIVHIPRSDEDNLVENQCKDYREGRTKGFIELDKDRGIVRVVDG